MVLRGRLEGMLEDRGVDGAERLLDSWLDEELPQVESIIAHYDQKPKKGPGLLAHFVKERVQGTRPEKAVSGPPSEKLLGSVRGTCLSPDGFDWAEAQEMYAQVAKRHGLKVEALVHIAVHPCWDGTPPHPAFLDRSLYGRWLEEPGRADPSLVRGPVESDDAWAERFWNWRV